MGEGYTLPRAGKGYGTMGNVVGFPISVWGGALEALQFMQILTSIANQFSSAVVKSLQTIVVALVYLAGTCNAHHPIKIKQDHFTSIHNTEKCSCYSSYTTLVPRYNVFSL